MRFLNDIGFTPYVDCIHVAQGKVHWRLLLNKAINFRDPQRVKIS